MFKAFGGWFFPGEAGPGWAELGRAGLGEAGPGWARLGRAGPGVFAFVFNFFLIESCRLDLALDRLELKFFENPFFMPFFMPGWYSGGSLLNVYIGKAYIVLTLRLCREFALCQPR